MVKKTLLYVLLPLVCVVLFGLYAVNGNKLAATQDELVSTQTELAAAQSDLAVSYVSLDNTKIQLSLAQSDLTETQNKLEDTAQKLTETTASLAQTKADFSNVSVSLALEKTNTAQLQTTVDYLQANISSLTAGYGYVYRDPTYAQAKAFLASDRTDANPYIEDTYVCEDFAYDVITHALQQKIRCAFVSIRYPDSAHAIIAFNTTDRGLVYFEPQSDEEVLLQAGKHFWQCIVVAPGYYYSPPDYDDTVERFNVIW